MRDNVPDPLIGPTAHFKSAKKVITSISVCSTTWYEMIEAAILSLCHDYNVVWGLREVYPCRAAPWPSSAPMSMIGVWRNTAMKSSRHWKEQTSKK